MLHEDRCRYWTGEVVRKNYALLLNNKNLCCSLNFADDNDHKFFICMGWHDYGEGHSALVARTDGTFSVEWVPDENSERIAWKVAWQPHGMVTRSDFDLDFIMPYVTKRMADDNPCLIEGTVEDTLEELSRSNINGQTFDIPEGYASWEDLARYMVDVGLGVFSRWREGT